MKIVYSYAILRHYFLAYVTCSIFRCALYIVGISSISFIFDSDFRISVHFFTIETYNLRPTYLSTMAASSTNSFIFRQLLPYNLPLQGRETHVMNAICPNITTYWLLHTGQTGAERFTRILDSLRIDSYATAKTGLCHRILLNVNDINDIIANKIFRSIN